MKSTFRGVPLRIRQEVYAARSSDLGEATIEFLAVVMIVVVPVFYLIVTLGEIQSAVYASEAGARAAARIVADNTDHVDAARLQITMSFQDYGIDVEPQVVIGCVPSTCSPGQSRVEVSVDARVPLPLLPDWMGGAASIPIQANVAMPVSGVNIE